MLKLIYDDSSDNLHILEFSLHALYNDLTPSLQPIGHSLLPESFLNDKDFFATGSRVYLPAKTLKILPLVVDDAKVICGLSIVENVLYPKTITDGTPLCNPLGDDYPYQERKDEENYDEESDA